MTRSLAVSPDKTAPVITIDGPSGSGKGAVATQLAKETGFHLLDSGALYRVLGVAADRAGVDFSDHNKIKALAASLNVEFGRSTPGSVHLSDDDVTLEIRTDRGSELASIVGAIPAAREGLLQRQLAFRQMPGLIADGRDMGTVVFPDAALKIFLTASVEERAERRHKQLIAKGIGDTLPALLRELKERDRRDQERTVSPLRPAEDAVIIDSTEMSLDAVLDQVRKLVAARVPDALTG
jgi:cytidylate kinase